MLIGVDRPEGTLAAAHGRGEDVFHRLDQLNDIGASLSLEKDINALLEKIVLAAKEITHADGGTLYLVEGEDESQQLRFQILRTASLGIALGGTTGREIRYEPIRLYSGGKADISMIAAYSALRGVTVNIADAYTAAGFDFSGTRAFDQRTGYRSRSFLSVPMKSHENEIIGVLQLINRIEPLTGEIVEFSHSDQRLAESLASQAAVALTNRRLVAQLEKLFESFIVLINSAIDEKSPYTGGHCQRVPILTMMLADAVDRVVAGPMRDFRMTDKDRYELRIAGLLHDCGKITTPVHVVDKATKLQAIYDRIDLIETRFEILRRDAELEAMRAKLAIAEEGGLIAAERALRAARVDARLRARMAKLDADLAFLRRSNAGSESMPAEDAERIRDIAAAYEWIDRTGEPVRCLSADEVKHLSIRSGTLTREERTIIRQHIDSTIRMLEALPWPKHLRNVPEYAGGHHERMDGKGYPRGLTREQMSVQARIMGIADIFEALTARDRPYKKGKTLSESMRILGEFSLNGHIDPDLFDIFIREKVYLKYAQQFMDPAQIDAVDERAIPGYRP